MNWKSIKERYKLPRKRLSYGGQAEVFEAQSRLTGKIVALKRILDGHPDTIARMRREIEVQSTLNHPNVMPILDYDKDFRWYTMPLAERVLSDLEHPISNEIIAKMVIECAQGLAAAHDRGDVHRDVKPNNILLLQTDDEIRWVVSDWGLVRRHGLTTIVRTSPGQSFGTSGFAAPELSDDAHAATEQADVYSLGRVVAWCATENPPRSNKISIPSGIWSDFIKYATQDDVNYRAKNMNQLIAFVCVNLGHLVIDENIRRKYQDHYFKDSMSADFIFRSVGFYSITVPANKEGGVNTGIRIRGGDTIFITAKGVITFDGGRDFTNPSGILTNPRGEPLVGFEGSQIFPHDDAYRVRNGIEGGKGLIGSLIGFIGEYSEENAFFIGQRIAIEFGGNKEDFLYLSVNDAKGTYDDNQGEYQVTLYMTK